MSFDYRNLVTIQALFQDIGPGSLEKEVQLFMDNVLAEVYPASEGYARASKHKLTGSEPDCRILQIQNVNAAISRRDILMIEAKRLQERLKEDHFDYHAMGQLNTALSQSTNNKDTILFAAVVIGQHIRFYKKYLHDGRVEPLHEGFWHLWVDAVSIMSWFEFFKKEAGWSDWDWNETYQRNMRKRYCPDGVTLEYDYD